MLTGDITSEIAEDDWERGCECIIYVTLPQKTAKPVEVKLELHLTSSCSYYSVPHFR